MKITTLAVSVAFYPFLILTVILCSCKSKAGKQVPSDKKIELRIDLVNVLSQHSKEAAVLVDVKYDHFFKKSKRYRGFPIRPILDSIISSGSFDTTGTVVILECLDGYKPIMDLSKFYGKEQGYIAIKDVDVAEDKEWPDSVSQKFKPYYLVWDDIKEEDHSYMWPYGLVAMTLVQKDNAYEAAYPPRDILMKGFVLYKDNCMKCHAINKIGGTIGPEFNIPKNITEYWRASDIIAYAKQPQSYRLNSHMPPVTNLSDAEFMELLRYIKSMKDNKIE